MVDLSRLLIEDPTLEAADRAIELQSASHPRREYLGASAIGHQCSRNLWYSIQKEIPRKPLDATNLKRIQDGHAGELVMAQRLRAVKGIELWTHQDNGEQIGGSLFDGRFQWHVDGVILGLLQAPKTPAVWEHKQVGEKGFSKFNKLKASLDEKQVLAEWEPRYFAQAQIYMYLLELTRHYLTVATPGGREYASCRTEINKPMARQLIDKAQRIIEAKSAPEKVSNTPDFYVCRYCEFADICHG